MNAAQAENLINYLFHETLRGCDGLKHTKEAFGAESEKYKLAHARFCALYGVIENSGLEEEYQAWKNRETQTSVVTNSGKCCLCGTPFVGEGNNPWPLQEKGRCCDECNHGRVIPARITRLLKREESEKHEL